VGKQFAFLKPGIQLFGLGQNWLSNCHGVVIEGVLYFGEAGMFEGLCK
jgi:hypothetical protein